MNTVFLVSELMLALAIVLTSLRLLIGPTMANRVVALDLLGVLAVGLMAVEAIRSAQYALVDVAIGVGIIAFIGTASFALLLDRDPGAQ